MDNPQANNHFPSLQGHVLVVDDDELFLKWIRAVLRKNGLQVSILNDPTQTESQLDALQPDIMLLDLMMPHRNGFQVCEAVRSHTRWRDLPILFLTGADASENRIQAFQAKGDDFITKPIVLDELYARLNVRLERLQLLRERQAMIQRLQEREQHLLTVLNQLNIGTILLDEQMRVKFINSQCQAYFGIDVSHLGLPIDEYLLLNESALQLVENMLLRPASERHRFSCTVHLPATHKNLSFEIDVQDNPNNENDRILYFYDVTELHDLKRQLQSHAHQSIIGQSQAVSNLLDHMHQVAQSHCAVVIEGETGVGKELVARSIHELSPRKDNPFIAVNCAGLTESLMTSQLFGHRRGAFTGAVADQKGLFEEADGGTLFLDEIGEIPPSVQAALLRVLQEQEIIRVGENKPRKVNVRILAATHRNLKEQINKGHFRDDLYYRLYVAAVVVPPLRKRKEDIANLVDNFLNRNPLAAEKGIRHLSHDAMQQLALYDWPGNIRQLQNALDYAVIKCRRSFIHVDDLPMEIQAPNNAPVRPYQHDSDEKNRIISALEAAHGNRTKAAKLLGIGRATLYRRMSQLNLGS